MHTLAILRTCFLTRGEIVMTSKNEKKGSGIASFETATRDMEAIIKVLEDDSTTLEQALASFELGIKLTRSAQKSLLEAEQKVQMLLENEGKPSYQDFEEQE